MRKRWIGFAVWLLLAAELYFFENNTGTRIILLCSALLPAVPVVRAAFFAADEKSPDLEKTQTQQTIRALTDQEEDEPGDVRPYRPGDPVQRIHWKLSAKSDEVLVRDAEPVRETREQERQEDVFVTRRSVLLWRRLLCGLAAMIPACLLLLLLIPGARLGAEALCNRLFAASEAVNAYAYRYFPVPEDQNTAAAGVLITLLLISLAALTVLLHNRLLILGLMAGCTLFQIYFGLSLPPWANVLLYGVLAVWMLKRPLRKNSLLAFASAVLLVSLLTALLIPGVDAATESASESVRDRVSQMIQQLTGTAAELPAGELETRHVYTQSLQNGGQASETEREYRLVTEKEEQISRPHWIDTLRIAFWLLMAIALLVLPFLPFLLLNSRRKKARAVRDAFSSADVNEAVCAIFRQVIAWLEATGHGSGNLLYRDWADRLPDQLPEGYSVRFLQCAGAFEEALYSSHMLPEEQRQLARSLLRETETALWQNAGWKNRILLKYWMCLCE